MKEYFMTKEYPCPYCGDACEVDDNDIDGSCLSCGTIYKVNRDAEFVDGMWKDLTKLTEADV